MHRCIVYTLLATIVTSSAFVLQSPVTKSRLLRTTLFIPRRPPLFLFWFGKDGDKQKTPEKKKSDRKGEGLGGVAQVMDNMEAFKKSQQVGTLTANLVQELSTMNVEGNAADNKIRIFFDGQQRPKRVQIDESYLRTVHVDDLNAALAIAMQDAYQKSREKMQEKLKDLYEELGLPPATSSRD
jgi:DNA-binding YbaB/EbfC family protein